MVLLVHFLIKYIIRFFNCLNKLNPLIFFQSGVVKNNKDSSLNKYIYTVYKLSINLSLKELCGNLLARKELTDSRN